MHLPVLPYRRIGLFAGLVLFITGLEVAVVQSSAFNRNPGWVSLGVTIDLAVGIPVLYYFLMLRRLNLPIRSLLAVVSLALGLTALILPVGYQQLTSLLRWVLLLAELGFVGFLLSQTSRIVRQYRQLDAINVDFIGNLQQSLDRTLGYSRFNRILVSELAVIRYGLLGWRAPVEKTDTDLAFTSHRESGQTALVIGLVFVGLIETVVVHTLLHRWSPLLAWFMSGAGLYGLLFFVADLVASIKRPVLIQANQVIIRLGLRGNGVIDKQQIEHVNPINQKPVRDPNTLNGALFTAPNVLITLREPVRLTGMLGIQKTVRYIALFIDDKQTFIHELGT